MYTKERVCVTLGSCTALRLLLLYYENKMHKQQISAKKFCLALCEKNVVTQMCLFIAQPLSAVGPMCVEPVKPQVCTSFLSTA